MKKSKKLVKALAFAIMLICGGIQAKAATYYPLGHDEWDCGLDWNVFGRYAYSDYVNYDLTHKSTAMRNGVYNYADWANAGDWSNATTSKDWKTTSSSGEWYSTK